MLLQNLNYSKLVIKELLERASFLCIRIKDYQSAANYFKQLVAISEVMYNQKEEKLMHPIVGF
jgi:hypothetical protein